LRLLILALLLVPAVAGAGELSLAETAAREVANDRFTARLEGRVEAGDPATAQAELNALMAEALAAVPAEAGLEVETGAYDVRPRPDQDRDGDEVEGWIARQTLDLDGADRAALIAAVADLQALGLATRGLGARLSDARADAVRDGLVREAIAAMRARAAVAAAALDQEVTGWLAVRLDGARPAPRMMQADAATARAGVAPELTVGTTTVRVTVEGTAELTAGDGGDGDDGDGDGG
jgi:predicted secreted protein